MLHKNSFENLERFLYCWQKNPKGLAEFVGRALGRVGYRNLPDLFKSFGSSYFSYQNICDLIDYLYEYSRPPSSSSKAGKVLEQSFKIDKLNDVLRIKDISGTHNNIRIMLLRDSVDGNPYYSIRYYIDDKEDVMGYLSSWVGKRPCFETVLNPLPNGTNPRYEVDTEFWNFMRPDESLYGVTIYPECKGFYDIKETKSVADLIILAANVFGI